MMNIQRLITSCSRCQARQILSLSTRQVIDKRKFHVQIVLLCEKNPLGDLNKEQFKQRQTDIAKNIEESYQRNRQYTRRKSRLGVFSILAISIGISTVVFLAVKPEKNEAINQGMVSLYRKMPLKPMSRVWGKMTSWELPMTLRQPLLGLYCWAFDVQLHEAEDSNLKNYKNLQEFFRRQLKPNIRIVCPKSAVTSPADGRVLHYGKVENGIVEQVKGVNYSIKGFLGPLPGDEELTKPLKDCQYQERMKLRPGNELYHCIIYLAPGDYHRFHSPCDWKIASRRHFPGELLSVNPGVARWVQGLFNMNERAVYTGTWEHGYFSYTAVGATNVGSIRIYFDENLETNTGSSHPNHVYHDRVFEKAVPISKGEMIGEFNLGSTVVLLFEAPKNFEFNINSGQKVKFGEPLGDFVN